jgi:hypothetical protein
MTPAALFVGTLVAGRSGKAGRVTLFDLYLPDEHGLNTEGCVIFYFYFP